MFANFPEPNDGWRVRAYDSPTTGAIELYLELKFRKEISEKHSRRVWRASVSTAESEGERQRAKLLFEAIARFLNAGGEVSELFEAARVVESAPELSMDKAFLLWTEVLAIALPSLTIGEEPTPALLTAHTFQIVDTDKVLIWEEDTDVRESTHEEMYDEPEHDPEDLRYRQRPKDEGEDSFRQWPPRLTGPEDS